MKNLSLLLVALACALLLSACGAGSAYRNSVNSWVGAPLEEMVAAWGEPGGSRTLADGRKEYLWRNATPPLWNEPQVYAPPAQYSDEDDFEYFKRVAEYNHNYRGEGYYSSIQCLSYVTVDSAGRVQKVTPESFMGLSDCLFVPPPPAR